MILFLSLILLSTNVQALDQDQVIQEVKNKAEYAKKYAYKFIGEHREFLAEHIPKYFKYNIACKRLTTSGFQTVLPSTTPTQYNEASTIECSNALSFNSGPNSTFSILDEEGKSALYLQDGSIVLEPKSSLGITYDGQNTVYFKAADDAKIQIVSKNTYHYIYCHQGAGELDTGNLTEEELPKIYLVNKNCLIKVQGSLFQPKLSLGGSFHSLNAYTMTDSVREKSKVEKTVIDQLSQDLNYLVPPITISSKISGENYQVIWQKNSLENLVCDLELKDKIQPTFKPAATLKIEKPAGSFLLSKAFVNQSVFLKCKDNSNHNTYSNLLLFE